MIESVGMMSDIYELQQIRQRISERYRSNPNIHINVSLRQPKLHLNNVPVKITAVYQHIFQVEETSSGAAVSKFSLTAMKRTLRMRKYCSM